MLMANPQVRLTQIIVRPGAMQLAQQIAAGLSPDARVLTQLDLSAPHRPDLLVECAGHEAVMTQVIPALESGLPCVLASIGALHEADAVERLQSAARKGRTRVELVSGAIGGIDVLAAAALGRLDSVLYVGRKPPRSWQGTPAEEVCALSELTAERVIFQGSAREAAHLFPKNANVAATVALAGLGMDRTRVELIADPGIERNVHLLAVSGSFGSMKIQLENLPLPSNPKTSALTVYSLARAVGNAAAAMVV
jgi:aspartate dehydrogenase